MKKSLFQIILLMIPFSLFGQTYSALWKKAADAEKKDLPQTQLEALREIVGKAWEEKVYGQLLKAELKAAQVEASVAPDSLKPAVERLGKQCAAIKDDLVLKTVYQTVIWDIYRRNWRLRDPENPAPVEKPLLTQDLCRQLAQVTDDSFSPFVIKNSGSKLFDHDLLSIVGYVLEEYWPLSEYYESVGNRPAACLTALEAVKMEGTDDYLRRLDSLIACYEDIPEAGEVAVERYEAMGLQEKTTVGERVEYARQAVSRWPGCTHVNALKNAVADLTAPKFSLTIDSRIALPQREQKIELTEVRNLKALQMKVYAVKGQGDLGLDPMDEEDYKKLKPLLTLLPEFGQEHPFSDADRKDYTVFADSMTLAALPVGVYMLEFVSQPSTNTVRRMFYVTDVFTLAEEQPDGQIRYVVVSATTGQPIAKAHVRIKDYYAWNKYNTYNQTTDAKGECFLREHDNRRREVFTYTSTDKASPEMNLSTRYNYTDARDLMEQTCLFTDRAIYRPGQTVHVAATVYEVRHGFEHTTLQGRNITFELRDANYKEVQRVTAFTDKYGTCAADLTLPASGLTGQFTIRANGQTCYVRVEEYKRPTFEVSFDPVKEHYESGDTVIAKATALSYAGVPVQGAQVNYRVVRRRPLWWWGYSRYWDVGYIGSASDDVEVAAGQAVTADDGSFTVQMPMVMPESPYPLFYNFVVTADVTDQGGETRTGSFSLPLGNRKTALSIDVDEKILAESQPAMTFHLRNAAGNDIDAQVKYRIDGGNWQTAKTNSVLRAPLSTLHSGRHKVEAEYEGETAEREFTVFSLDDKRPAIETDDWFWLSDTSFPNDGKPVTLQVGSSAKDVHIVYSIFSGETCLESGSVDKSNELINRKLTYKEAWGNGILLTFAWVKENKCYTHTATIRRPVPDKRLKLSWNTFRDRLTPGQQEEWTLTVTDPDGKPADALLMSVLYDKSLDQIVGHNWRMNPFTSLPLPSASWTMSYRHSLNGSAVAGWKALTVGSYRFSHFDESVYPTMYSYSLRGSGRRNMLSTRALARAPMVESAMAVEEAGPAHDEVAVMGYAMKAKESVAEPDVADADFGEEPDAEPTVQLRENLSETAFFYPQLVTDGQGQVTLKFTLPESLTTWRFMGLAHTTDMCYGRLDGEAVAKKELMIQPNMPRFVREGDEATISARIFNTGEKDASGTARLRLINPETEQVVFETSEPFSVSKDGTTSVAFPLSLSNLNSKYSILICQVLATGEGFSDGEQHYLPILPNTEHITVTLPFTQIEPGTKTIDLKALIPEGSTQQKLTVEYTNHPAWLMIQALPTVGQPCDENAISQAASLYANSIGRYIISQNPAAKKAFKLWQQESGSETSLMSSLEKNTELKDLLLNETPWVLDAERETEQKHRLADFFDENTMQMRRSSAVEKLKKLQKSNGAWTWWPDMPGSFYMTVAVSEMLVRLNVMAGKQPETAQMLSGAFTFMGREIVDEVAQMKKAEKKGIKPTFPSFKALQWLYLSTLDGRSLPSEVTEANLYLLNLLKKDIKRQTIYEKAMTAVILAESPLLKEADRLKAREYVQSLKEYTVYREEMGRYYDTPRAGYSWYDYKIPTQTMAIEALQRITPDDRQTIMEMQRWLLQSKRTQAWDTPINSVNAVYAFLYSGSPLSTNSPLATLQVDGQPLETPKATAAIGYVKSPVDAGSKTLTVEKTSEGTSWGAVYAQFMQPARDIRDTGSGLTVKREFFVADSNSGSQLSTLKVGDRVKVRITIEADRDYDFVQLIDRRAACLEPVRQLSGYHSGSYCTPRDNTTNYYFDRLSKGRHVIESEYYIDRPGTYETGSCTVGCAYAPEFRGITKSQTINVK